MKTKKLTPAMMLLAITMVVYLVATVLCCYTTKPEVTEGQFPFSITYEYKGETGTLSGVLECAYSGSYTIFRDHYRYWDGEVTYDNPENLEEPYIIDYSEELQTTLSLHENMHPGYFMGDPLHKDYYDDFGLESAGPYVTYIDHKNSIFLDDENQEEVLESIGFKILDVTYAEPIENRFSFSGIRYEGDNIILFAGIMLIFFLLCLIFVRKDPGYRYTRLDKFGVVMNFVVAIVGIPVVSLVCMFFGLAESRVEIVDQIIYNIPPASILCLALSVVFRRKGYSKTGFFVQFGGILVFAIIFVLEAIFRFH